MMELLPGLKTTYEDKYNETMALLCLPPPVLEQQATFQLNPSPREFYPGMQYQPSYQSDYQPPAPIARPVWSAANTDSAAPPPDDGALTRPQYPIEDPSEEIKNEFLRKIRGLMLNET